jgi:hypothetical protein
MKTSHKIIVRSAWLDLLNAPRLFLSLLCTLTLGAATSIASSTNRSPTSDRRFYTTAFSVDQTPDEVFAAINDVRGWWSEEITGVTDKAGSAFGYHFKDLHRCALKITELIPGKKISWRVVDGYLSFVKDKSEWTGTTITFEITRQGDKTDVRFTHVGLVPEFECYNACSDGWTTYINGSLRNLITTGKGQPNVGRALTDSERELAR